MVGSGSLQNLVTWRSKKQVVVARSSEEAKFKAMSHGICELLWIKIILTGIRIEVRKPMQLYSNNKVAINSAYNLIQHDRTKHVEVGRQFIKEKLDSELVRTTYMPTTQLDILREGLPNVVFLQINDKLRMQNIFHQCEGDC